MNIVCLKGTFSSPSDTSHPELACKAHDVRVMIGWLSIEAARAVDVSTDHGKPRAALAWAQEELCLSMEQAPRYLTDDGVRNRILKAGEMFLDLYVDLAERFQAAGIARWHLLRKTHLLIHLLEDCALDLLNPRCYSGWTDESLMHKIVVMASGADSRTAIHNILVGWFPLFVERLRRKNAM